MAFHMHSLNRPSTTGGANRLHAFLKSQRCILNFITPAIIEYEKNLETCTKTILSLNSHIARAGDAQKTQQNYMDALSEARSQLNIANSTFGSEKTENPELDILYDGMKSYVASPISTNQTVLQDEARKAESWMTEFKLRLNQMEEELKHWKMYEELNQTALQQLMLIRPTVDHGIEKAWGAIKSIWLIPNEIWTEIFIAVIKQELAEYHMNHEQAPLRVTALSLSHVCNFWRTIIQNDSKFWRIATAHPCKIWPTHKYELFTYSFSKAPSTPTIVVNLSQTLDWTNEIPHSRLKRKRNMLQKIYVPDSQVARTQWSEVLHGKDYSICLNMLDYNWGTFEKVTHLPFDSASAITILARAPLREDGSFTDMYLSRFRSLRSLSIIMCSSTLLPTAEISLHLPALKRLEVRVKTLPQNFQISGYLSPGLEELHIRQEDDKVVSLDPANIQLVKLKILLVTLGCLVLLDQTRMPNLKHLTLHGSPISHITEEYISLQGENGAYNKLSHFEVVRWGGSQNRSVTAVELFGKFAAKMDCLRSVRFDDSQIDGEDFIQIVDTAFQGLDVGFLPKLEEVTLSNVTGITRNECDRLKLMVKKLNIYV